MKCQNDNCTRNATSLNMEYHKDKWLCTFHSNKEIKQGRINKKILKNN